MFSFFKKKKQHAFVTDLIWISTEAKLSGLGNRIQTLLREEKKIGLFYYFDEMREWLTEALASFELSDKGIASITLFPAAEIIRSSRANSELNRFINSTNYQIIFAEHHPFHSKDEFVFQTLFELTGKTQHIEFYISLNEPLFAIFGLERIQQVMVQIGHKEGEAMRHSMITKSIVRAQEKIEKKVQNELCAKSSAEWFELNYVAH